MQIKSGDQIEEREAGHNSVGVNGLSVECVRDRATDDDQANDFLREGYQQQMLTQ